MRTNHIPPSLLRKCETHVRVMSFPEKFHASHVKTQNGNYENVLVHSVGGNNQNADNNNGSPNTNASPSSHHHHHVHAPREFSGFTRIHQNGLSSNDNQVFYDDVLKKIIPAALAGQSYTILFCGAPNSGRSQTMYTIDQSRMVGGGITHGMLHYIAKDLLNSGPNVKTFVNAYYARGNECRDSRTKKVAPIRNYASPLGPTPEVTSLLLQKPEDAMIIPVEKRADQTNFVTFEIFHQHPNNNNNNNSNATGVGEDAASSGASMNNNNNNNNDRRGAFSLITLVDVAQFDSPLPEDVVHLRNSISRQIAGSDPLWGTCKVTELLEYSLCRGRTVIGIGTVVGEPTSYFEKTCACLDFVALLSNLEQVASIAQFHHPKWLPELPGKIAQMDRQHEERWKRNYERGVFEVYRKMQEALSAKLREVGKLMEDNNEPSERLAELRQVLRQRLEEALRQIQAGADQEVSRIDRSLALAADKKRANDKAQADAEHQLNLQRALLTDCAARQGKIDTRQEEINHAMVALDVNTKQTARFANECVAETNQAHSDFRDKKKLFAGFMEKLNYQSGVAVGERGVELIKRHQERLELILSDVTASCTNHSNEQRRERLQHSQQNNNNINNGGGNYLLYSNNHQKDSATNSRGGSQQQKSSSSNIHQSQQQQQQQQATTKISGNRRSRSADHQNLHENEYQQQQQQQNQKSSVHSMNSSGHALPPMNPSSSNNNNMNTSRISSNNNRSSILASQNTNNSNNTSNNKNEDIDEGSPQYVCQMMRNNNNNNRLGGDNKAFTS